MKNIYIIPTPNPSRLGLHKNGALELHSNALTKNLPHYNPQHLYITSDEEIKDARLRWIIDNRKGMNGFIHQVYVILDSKICPEIILTTDQDLIKDGIQAIDDTFLEWFVKNPSCESVKTDLVPVNEFGSEITVNSYGFDKFKYKIILPQEEPKQETLEEAAEKLYSEDIMWGMDLNKDTKNAFIQGAKWQQENMIEELEMHILVNEHDWNRNPQAQFRDFVEQFKKK
jgi:hypothetical protein